MTDLYPLIEPHGQGMLDVGQGNQVYWETSGNLDSKPAGTVTLGSAGACAPATDPAQQ